MKATDKKSVTTVSTIWHNVRIGDEIVLINIRNGKVKYRLFGLEFTVMQDDRFYANDAVSEVVVDWLGFLTKAAVASAAWEAQQRICAKDGVDDSGENREH